MRFIEQKRTVCDPVLKFASRQHKSRFVTNIGGVGIIPGHGTDRLNFRIFSLIYSLLTVLYRRS